LRTMIDKILDLSMKTLHIFRLVEHISNIDERILKTAEILALASVVAIPLYVIYRVETSKKKSSGKKLILPVLGEVEIPGEALGEVSPLFNLSKEEMVEAIARSKWARNYARAMCEGIQELYGREQYNKCVERIARWIAEKVVM